MDNKGNLSVVYPNCGASNSTIEYVRVQGGVPSAPVDVSQSPLNSFAFDAKVAVEPVSGRIWVTWREQVPGATSAVYVGTSTDGGQTFSPKVRISDPTRPAGAPALAVNRLGGSPLIVYGELNPNQLLFQLVP